MRDPLQAPRHSIRTPFLWTLAVLMISGVAGLGLVSATQLTLAREQAQLASTRAAQLQAATLLEAMVDQETGIRGFALTGNPVFLEPYASGKIRAAQAVERLSGTGRKELPPMILAARNWQTWAEHRRESVMAAGPDGADNQETLVGKALFDRFRTANDRYREALTADLQAVQKIVDRQSAHLVVFTLGLAAVNLLGILFIGVALELYLLRPLRGLARTVVAVARGGTPILPRRRRDELGLLTEALGEWQWASGRRRKVSESMVEVSRELNVESAINLAAVHLRTLIDADQVIVALAGPDGPRIAVSAPLPLEAGPLPPDSFGGVSLAEQRVVFADLEKAGEWATPIAHWRGKHSFGPLMAQPLVAGGAAVGTAICLRLSGRPAFSESDAEWARLVTAPMAASIQVGSIFRELNLKNAELERASRFKSQFLASMSHELRTPLNSILGFSELLLDPDRTYSEEKRTTYLATIRRSGQHLLGLINDILDLSKIEAGRVTVDPQVVAVSEIIAQAAASVESLAAARSIRIDLRSGSEVRLRVDPRHLRQIILNLLGNSIKFTPESGRIRLSARRRGDQVVVSVADNGAGIAGLDQERVFKAFEQGDQGASNVTGTGLGLALTRRLVELNGGQISVSSVPGKGSIFSASFPALLSEGLHVAPVDPNRGDGRPLVLVVEDDDESSRILADHLEGAGFAVEIVTDGATAIERARRARPVAITLDIVLPQMHGWDVLSALKLDPATREIPVVVVSIVDNLPLGRALGALDYFVKPADPKQLVARLTAAGCRPGKVRRVLVIDDDRSELDRIRQGLKAAGCTVITADSGAEGVALAGAERPDAILTDLLMPGMSGFEVIAQLKSEPRTADIPILVLTALDLSQGEREALGGQVSAILSKQAGGSVDLISCLEAAGISGEGMDDAAG